MTCFIILTQNAYIYALLFRRIIEILPTYCAIQSSIESRIKAKKALQALRSSARNVTNGFPSLSQVNSSFVHFNMEFLPP